MNKEKVKIKKNKVYEPSVLWMCPFCGAFNLHPIGFGEFKCLQCGVIYQIFFDKKKDSK